MADVKKATFEQLYKSLVAQNQLDAAKLPECLLAIDPGETLGWAYLVGLHLQEQGQLNTSDPVPAFESLNKLFDRRITKVVLEDYRVYQWKAKDHAWNPLMTVRVIGMIELLCLQKGIPLTKQSAQVGKAFMTDDRLKQFGFYVRGQRHARDAIRHACQYILFNRECKP